MAAAAVAVAVEVPDAKKLPPGFRFHPSDEEVVGYYLKNKVSGKKPDIEVIREIDLYKSEPWDLPEKSILPTRDLEWYFFCPRDKKYPNGSRSNRATEKGYWKATGKDRKVKSQSKKIGMKKTLVFYEGRAPRGQRTDWLMHEYRLDETECIGAPHLQELYVVCRVFKKGKQGLNNGEQHGTGDDFELSPSKSNLSPTKVNSVGEIEEQSEERSSPLMQEDDTQTNSGLRSETSSEIIDNKNEDNTCFEWSMESLQGQSNPDYSSTSLNETNVNNNAAMEVGTREWPIETQMWELEDLPLFPPNFGFDDNEFSFGDVMDAYRGDGISHVAQASEQDNLGCSCIVDGVGDSVGGGYIKELDDFLQSFNERNNDEPCFEDVNDRIQFRTRPSPLQSHQQPLPSQGTAIRRLRLQIYKNDEPAECNKQHGLTGHCQSEWHDCNTDDSETVTQMEGSAPVSLSRKANSFEEDDADSGFAYDSSEASERVTNDHTLTVAPAQTLASGLSTGESSERSENSLNATGSEEKSILSETSDSLKSSGYGQSSCGCDGPLIDNIQDNNERPQEHFNKSVGNGVSISVIRGQTLIAKAEHIAKCEVTASESNSEIHNQGPEFGDSLVKGWKMISHGTSSTELQPESEISSTSAKEMKLGKESMKYSATSLKKGNLASDTIASFSSHSTGIEETGVSCEGKVKHVGFNSILYGLKLRGKSRTKDMVFDGKEKPMDVTESFSYHCSKEGANGYVNLWKARGILKWFSKLQSKFSRGSNSISLLMGLLGTAVLVFFIRVMWQLARSSPPIIL